MMNTSKRGVRGFAVGAAVLAAGMMASQASAAVFTTAGSPISMTLLNGTGSSIDIGGLTFYNFAVTNRSGDMPTDAGVTVTPELLTIGSTPTVGFRLGGGFLDSGFSAGASDFLLSYEVKTNDGSLTISDAHIQGNPAVFGNGLATVTDTWLPDITGSKIKISDFSAGGFVGSDKIDFANPFSHLTAQKDILLFAADTSSASTLSFVDQTYSLVGGGTGTPEPASLGVLGLGAMALLARRRR